MVCVCVFLEIINGEMKEEMGHGGAQSVGAE